MTLIDTATGAPATVRSIFERSSAILRASGVTDPEVDAELLIGHVLGASRGRVQSLVVTDAALGAEDTVAIAEAVERRVAREPLQHITGVAWFRSLELAVGPGVFVPRPETEFVAQLAIDALRAVVPAEGAHPLAVDLGTGSGAIALSLATEVPHAEVVAVENSTAAFVWAKQNLRSVGAENARIVFIDLADALPELDGTVDVVASNPPYIPVGAIPRDPEVRLHDPEHALYGGPDGLDVVRDVSATAKRLLRPGGSLVIEHGDLQGAEMRALLGADGWRAVATHRDLTGRDRATTGIR
ncbi:peptide chain release factor N(5)-glutamine methyltransferase [Herbiconiux sp. VKM Ac-2851]|uniref:peptide chain release factor N(5)-glutamine methyltransferase n=1 Tax=Herbiconiux sp. VKM Ac-2851 TaxID=2739025 RepID=UPI001566C60F|nr:peptide chain release factor N(5)-glutamine methyltransferase [Herbiconiux sp. VKM Ac-2851]NQX33973.1 peptide chain release factor N(5)-glutamine methyltransferase [Herbiconiux sp. VKM Ac-2851]